MDNRNTRWWQSFFTINNLPTTWQPLIPSWTPIPSPVEANHTSKSRRKCITSPFHAGFQAHPLVSIFECFLRVPTFFFCCPLLFLLTDTQVSIRDQSSQSIILLRFPWIHWSRSLDSGHKMERKCWGKLSVRMNTARPGPLGFPGEPVRVQRSHHRKSYSRLCRASWKLIAKWYETWLGVGFWGFLADTRAHHKCVRWKWR